MMEWSEAFSKGGIALACAWAFTVYIKVIFK